MHDKTRVRLKRATVKLDASAPGQADLPQAEQLEDQYRSQEVADLFEAAGELGLNRLAGHVLAEASLDYVTDVPFDDTDDEKTRVKEPDAAPRRGHRR